MNDTLDGLSKSGSVVPALAIETINQYIKIREDEISANQKMLRHVEKRLKQRTDNWIESGLKKRVRALAKTIGVNNGKSFA